MSSPVENLVEARGATKRFGRRTALDRVDLHIGEGEIVGLAGPNGSGKTTLLKLLAGLSRPSSGEVRVLGLDPYRKREEVMRAARFAFAPPPLYEALTAREHLVHLSRLAGRGAKRPEVDAALDLVGLAERATDRVHTFSFGMRQRLILAQAVLPRPRLLVLDEPADGLDPKAVLELRAILSRLRSEHGVAILLASHLLFELDKLVDRLLVLSAGRQLFQGTPDELRGPVECVRIRLRDHGTIGFDRVASALGELGARVRPGDEGSFLLEGSTPALEQVRERLGQDGLELAEYALERPSLEGALIARLAEEAS